MMDIMPTDAQWVDLEQSEKRISHAIKNAFHVFGSELGYINERGLYILRGYKNIGEYGEDVWELKSTRTYQLIEAAQAYNELSTLVENKSTKVEIVELPSRETHMRPLLKLKTSEERLEAWANTLRSVNGGRVTGKIVEAEVTRYIEAQKQNWITVDEWNAGKRWHGGMSKSTMNETNDNIEWAAWSWNPVTGCLHGCDYCYARDIAARFYPQEFAPSFIPERLSMPGNTSPMQPRWEGDTGNTNVFTCSMADLFGKWVPEEWITSVIDTVADNPQWNFLFLTKFPIRMAEFEYPDNVWLGTTADRQWAVERAEKAFTKIKASGFGGVCWLSCEPMLERLTFTSLDMFDWVIMGGSAKSSQTVEYHPPFEDILHLYNQARDAGCQVYQKTNLFGDASRVREYPNA